MEVREFIQKWRRVRLKERSAAQEHFIDLCRVFDHPTPAEADPEGTWYTFEAGTQKAGGGQGFADVWKKGFFAWEYKGPHKDLDEAYQQLLRYHDHLEQPPLLVVSDMQEIEIHTKFTNTVPRTYQFSIEDLVQPTFYGYLHSLFHDPQELRPDLHPDRLTEEAAEKFAELAEELRRRGYAPRPVAHFLTQALFCFFAEDIGLLPRDDSGKGLFTKIIKTCQRDQFRLFPQYTGDLFEAMASGGHVLLREVAHFNGGLFEPGVTPDIPALKPEEMSRLDTVADLDWGAVEPSIFGTLFERGLDPAKRSQIGAHYTSRADIEAIVEPVLMDPLRREWEAVRASGDNAARLALLNWLATIRVLDPACGSGNFLYVSLNLLKDLEKAVIIDPAFADTPEPAPRVHPRQLYGIEISEYAHELASVVVWIGYIQWHRNNGYSYEQKPILQRLDTIQCMDAILGWDEDNGALYKPEWPEVDVIVGNPPFLGGKKLREGLGDAYVDALFTLYDREVPREADLVTYWFERARQEIETNRVQRAGLLATQGIRGSANRQVLERIKESGDIFFAYSDREWILDGAAVQVSMVGFDDGGEMLRLLDDTVVDAIHPDLTGGINLTRAKKLPENANIVFMGVTRGGPFELPPELAKTMLEAPLNPNGCPNSDVVRPWRNAADITRRSRDFWIIDFGVDMCEEEAALYEMPFEYVKRYVKPERDKNKRRSYRENWWLHAEARPGMREALEGLGRFIVTPLVSKHRIFTWLDTTIVPENLLNVFARSDDYFFGVLHSEAHELWALRQGTQLESRPRYTPTTTFETFPLPWPPGQEPEGDPLVEAIAEAAWELNEKREAWLNPERGPHQEEPSYQEMLKARTLTNLYNKMPEWLRLAHEKLDRAVFAAYGWEYPLEEEEILRRLLALNLEREVPQNRGNGLGSHFTG